MRFENNGQTYEFFNSTEEPVLKKVRLALNDIDMCRCDKCYYDICAIVLNNMGAPRYVTSPHGALMNKASFLNTDTLGNFYAEIYRAIDLVKKSPRH